MDTNKTFGEIAATVRDVMHTLDVDACTPWPAWRSASTPPP